MENLHTTKWGETVHCFHTLSECYSCPVSTCSPTQKLSQSCTFGVFMEKEQYCIGTWNVRSMNQGKSEVVKQEMASVNGNILGISELKRTGMGEFNSDDHYIYYCGQESLRRNGVAITVNKRGQNAVLGCNLKNNRMISVRFQGKPFNITVIQVYPWPVMLKQLKLNGSMKTYNTFRTNTQKKMSFTL